MVSEDYATHIAQHEAEIRRLRAQARYEATCREVASSLRLLERIRAELEVMTPDDLPQRRTTLHDSMARTMLHEVGELAVRLGIPDEEIRRLAQGR